MPKRLPEIERQNVYSPRNRFKTKFPPDKPEPEPFNFGVFSERFLRIRRSNPPSGLGVFLMHCSWPVVEDQSDRVNLSHEELSLLLVGIDLTRTRRKEWYRKMFPESEKV